MATYRVELLIGNFHHHLEDELTDKLIDILREAGLHIKNGPLIFEIDL